MVYSYIMLLQKNVADVSEWAAYFDKDSIKTEREPCNMEVCTWPKC